MMASMTARRTAGSSVEAGRWLSPRRKLRIIKGDGLPRYDLVLVRDEDEDWCVGIRCPCGCGDPLELIVLPTVEPRWDVAGDWRGRVSLNPSVWRRMGCRPHFWLRAGKIVWCE